MGLNIKNEEIYRLVKELAAMKGVGLTTAVGLAVRNEMEREKESCDPGGSDAPKTRSEVLQSFAKEFSRKAKHPLHSWDVDTLLYDENGLPK